MNLRTEIVKEHSKAQCDKIVAWVGTSQQRFDQLFSLFLNDEYRVVQRAAWPMGLLVESNPVFIKIHWKHLIKKLQDPAIHDAVKRNCIRMLQDVKIPKQYSGAIMNYCFQYLESPTEAVAVKVFSMSVLANMAKDYPEIIPEIKLLIEDQLPEQSAGFKSRAKKILHRFSLL